MQLQTLVPVEEKDLKIGSLLRRPLNGFLSLQHEGIFVGDGKVCHVPGPEAKMCGPTVVSKVSLEEFCNEKPVTVVTVEADFTGEEIARRALSREGETWNYDILKHNCQDFTHWCYRGSYVSWQALDLINKDLENFVNHLVGEEPLLGLAVKLCADSLKRGLHEGKLESMGNFRGEELSTASKAQPSKTTSNKRKKTSER